MLSRCRLTSLKTLLLPRNLILSEGVLHITNMDMPNLQNLNISENRIGDVGASCLIRGDWPKLEMLSTW